MTRLRWDRIAVLLVAAGCWALVVCALGLGLAPFTTAAAGVTGTILAALLS